MRKEETMNLEALGDVVRGCSTDTPVVIMLDGHSYAVKEAKKVHVNCIDDDSQSGVYLELFPDKLDLAKLAAKMWTKEQKNAIQTVIYRTYLARRLREAVGNMNALTFLIDSAMREAGEEGNLSADVKEQAQQVEELLYKLQDSTVALTNKMGLGTLYLDD